jgi:coenzyme F420-0:L-glutamate ligase/coenzyme F420-1:gamma-L-glutamate ligase
VVLLRATRTRSARACAPALPGRPAVVIADSFGRAWRHGQCDVAIGIAGLTALDDWRGRTDRSGRALLATSIAIADEAARPPTSRARARTRASRWSWSAASSATSPTTTDRGAPLIRPREDDLFR